MNNQTNSDLDKHSFAYSFKELIPALRQK
jgi:tetratricopeptide (TPR) repeat protein